MINIWYDSPCLPSKRDIYVIGYWFDLNHVWAIFWYALLGLMNEYIFKRTCGCCMLCVNVPLPFRTSFIIYKLTNYVRNMYKFNFEISIIVNWDFKISIINIINPEITSGIFDHNNNIFNIIAYRNICNIIIEKSALCTSLVPITCKLIGFSILCAL